MKCPSCGGTLVPKDSGKYKCAFCGTVVDELPESKKSISIESSNRQTMGVSLKSGLGSAVFESNINGVAELSCRFSDASFSGSGFLINEDGYLLTNTHVVTNGCKPCKDITVHICGQNVRAKIMALGDDQGGRGDGVDLALLRLEQIPKSAKVIKLENFENVRIGEDVYVIGNSLGYGTCITGGIVSDKRRDVNGKILMMTDCAVNGGNSGGPIFNGHGKAVGAIVSGITAAEGMNFAIPSDIIQQFLRQNKVSL